MPRAWSPRGRPRLLTLVFHPGDNGSVICNRVRRHGIKSIALTRREQAMADFKARWLKLKRPPTGAASIREINATNTTRQGRRRMRP